jgi:hypothetical protein
VEVVASVTQRETPPPGHRRGAVVEHPAVDSRRSFRRPLDAILPTM